MQLGSRDMGHIVNETAIILSHPLAWNCLCQCQLHWWKHCLVAPLQRLLGYAWSKCGFIAFLQKIWNMYETRNAMVQLSSSVVLLPSKRAVLCSRKDLLHLIAALLRIRMVKLRSSSGCAAYWHGLLHNKKVVLHIIAALLRIRMVLLLSRRVVLRRGKIYCTLLLLLRIRIVILHSRSVVLPSRMASLHSKRLVLHQRIELLGSRVGATVW